MNRVAVISDSSTCLPPRLIRDFDITILPINESLEGELDDNGAAVDKDLLDEYAEQELSGANHPFVTEYLHAVESSGTETAVMVTPAYEFAAMHRNASLAASLSEKEAYVVDSRTAAAGQAIVVLAGAKAAQAGFEINEVLDLLKEASRNVVLVAALGDTEHIARSSVLSDEDLSVIAQGHRSIFSMKNGEIQSLGEADSSEEALEAIADIFRETTRGKGAEQVAVFHAGTRSLADRLSEMCGGSDFISGFSIAMQVHTGPGVVGAAWLPRNVVAV